MLIHVGTIILPAELPLVVPFFMPAASTASTARFKSPRPSWLMEVEADKADTCFRRAANDTMYTNHTSHTYIKPNSSLDSELGHYDGQILTRCWTSWCRFFQFQRNGFQPFYHSKQFLFHVGDCKKQCLRVMNTV